jgi:outer membrane protein assembly factor BamB
MNRLEFNAQTEITSQASSPHARICKHFLFRQKDTVKHWMLLGATLLSSLPSIGQSGTFGGDPQRTGWAKHEPFLNKENVSSLELKWKLHLDNVPKEMTSLTTAVVADSVKTDHGIKDYVIVAGSSDNIYAIDGDTGRLAWQKSLPNDATPQTKSNTLCPFGLNATPVVQNGRPKVVFAISTDGKLHAFSAVNGEDRFPPVQFVPAFSKNWSLNQVGDLVYTAVSQRCNQVQSGVYAIDVKRSDHPVATFSTGRPGIWGRAGVAISARTGTVFAETGDGVFDLAAGQISDSFIALAPQGLKLIDIYTPANREWLTLKDLDMGSISPVVFEMEGKEYLVGGGKEGRLFLLDTQSLGGETHHKPLLRTEPFTNEEAAYAAHGFWGSFATAVDTTKTRWIFAPAWGPPHSKAPAFSVNHGEVTHGSIMAFRIVMNGGVPSVVPAWISRDLNVPEPPIYANGVLYVLSSGEDVAQADANGNGLATRERAGGSTNAVLYALDAETGKELFSSKDTMRSFTHFGGLTLANGRIYVTNFDGNVYAFGLHSEDR